jgi:spore coat protein CotH
MQSLSLNEEGQSSVLSSIALPVIHIDTKGSDIGRNERIPATVRIESASGLLPNDSTTFTHQVGIKVRGASAVSYPKKSYSIEFCDSMGEEVNVSLFGLRSDGDWILDAMYIDHSRMRNRLCTDIWNAYNRIPHKAQEPKALNGTRGVFVEVSLNGEYNGLYCLTERIDRKQLKLKKYKEVCRGVSYKAATWNNLMGWCAYNPEAKKETLLWNGFEAEYPDVLEEVCWGYLQEFLEFISPDYTSDERFASEIESFVHLENVIDYSQDLKDHLENEMFD